MILLHPIFGILHTGEDGDRKRRSGGSQHYLARAEAPPEDG
jgi:hypothetical protein